MKNIKYDKNGLIPVVVQDYYTKEVLTVAYMNQESLKISIEEKKTCFYSRSRQELWRKGATSGNYQNIVSIKSDCDNDALVIEVIKDGPACHEGTESCFNNVVFKDTENTYFSLPKLYNLIKERKTNKTDESYTSYLFEKGLDKILKKVGEESTEVVIAAKNTDNQELVYELSDLAYHSLVLMIEKDITLDDIMIELASRQVVDKKDKN